MAAKHFALALAATLPAAQASEQTINPIRKVVSLLQAMQKKVTEEGEREKDLYDKYMCYCKTNGNSLSDGIAANEDKSSALTSDIKKAEEEKAATQEALEQAQDDRAAAKSAMAEATGIREKEAAAYAAEKASYDSNLFALLGRCNVQKPGGEYGRAECATMGGKWVGAIDAIEHGMAGAFLQTNAAQVLLKLVQSKQDMLDADREDVMAFLQGTSEYAPQSGEIVGILKQMADEMGKGLAEAEAAEDSAVKAYEALMAAKTKEVNALTASIEKKLTKVGELSVSITEMKNELGDTAQSILADKEFLENLEKNCKTKTAEWDVIVKTRAEELTALAETIKILNDDDALELFKKTLPSAASFVQLQQGTSAVRARALAALLAGRRQGSPDKTKLDLIGLALRGEKIGFDKVIKMIDEMVATLKKEQVTDDNKKQYCAVQFDESDDKKKGLEKALSDTEAAIASNQEGIAALADEIAALDASIKALDKSVAEATEQRKNEHQDFKDLMASDSAAKELINFAKNRLNKFYNPKLYKAPPKVELSKEDRIFVSEGGTPPPTTAPGGIANTGIAVLAEVSLHGQDAPPPAPEAPGAYKKKSGENSGVLAMMDLLVQDLDKEMAEAGAAEKDAQADYEQLMQDSAAKRTSDSALLTEKTANKASMEGDLQANKDSHAALTRDHGATLKYIAELHAECDWLLKFFEIRKEARASEIDALGKAKAVLSGADYSLVQTRRVLRGSA